MQQTARLKQISFVILWIILSKTISLHRFKHFLYLFRLWFSLSFHITKCNKQKPTINLMPINVCLFATKCIPGAQCSSNDSSAPFVFFTKCSVGIIIYCHTRQQSNNRQISCIESNKIRKFCEIETDCRLPPFIRN